MKIKEEYKNKIIIHNAYEQVTLAPPCTCAPIARASWLLLLVVYLQKKRHSWCSPSPNPSPFLFSPGNIMICPDIWTLPPPNTLITHKQDRLTDKAEHQLRQTIQSHYFNSLVSEGGGDRDITYAFNITKRHPKDVINDACVFARCANM